ncbi:MAG TPA: FAD-binding protein [Candidatus Dormibacteraeota bacterium]|nr:FAD-binding protein [Candidatus Dormibacteraeota bacterium]
MATPIVNHDEVTSDILVIGAGGAGMRGAIAASDAGLKVAVVCKSLLGKAHTVMAEGGMAAALANVAKPDSWKTHFSDTMKGGKLLNNWRMAEIHAKEAPERVLELERWGAVFDRTTKGLIHQRSFGGHTYPRLAHIGDRTGLELIRSLQDHLVHQPNVDVHMETTVTRLLVSEGRVWGALAYRRQDGGLVVFKAKSVLLASGGLGKIYRVTSNSWESTGDGTAIAYQAGATVQDCEMVQFHPTGMVWPAGVRGILVTEGVRGEGGFLRNAEGERFMERYDPERMELSTRDVVARAINQEVLEGRGSPHGGAFLDISHKPADYILRRLPSMYEQFHTLADIDITKEPMEVAPTIHYAMSGVRVEPENGATTIEGLFAAGEVACGLHGANRLGGNSLSDLLVFGKRAGDGAVAYASDGRKALSGSDGEVDRAIEHTLAPLGREDGENPYTIHAELQDTLTRFAPIIREESGLRTGLGKVKELQERVRKVGTGGGSGRAFNPGWHAALDVESMVDNAEGVFLCALERRESRGAHTRLDYPELDEELGKVNFVVRREEDDMKVDSVAKEPIPPEYLEIINAEYTKDFVRED